MMKLITGKAVLIGLVIVSFLVREIQSKCNYEKPFENDCDCIKALDSQNNCVSNCALGDILQDYQPQLKFKKCVTCIRGEQVVGYDKTICVDKCEYDKYILDSYTNTCILQSQCNGFYYEDSINRLCFKECPTNYYVTYQAQSNSHQQGICTKDKCPTGFYSQMEGKICKNSCEQGQITDLVNNNCLKNKNLCSGYISREGRYCTPQCSEFEYPVQKDGYFQCQICLKFIYNQDNKQNQCLEECPSSKPLIYYIGEIKVCQTQEFCSNYLISSDKLSCSSQCRNPDLIEEVLIKSSSKSKCVKKCSINKGFIREEVSGKYCDGDKCKKLLSSDGKKCINDCKDIAEIKVNDKCEKCQSDELYERYNHNTNEFECSFNSRSQSGVLLRLESLTQYISSLQSIYRQEQQEYIQIQLETILTDLNYYQILQKNIQSIYQLLVHINSIQVNKYINKPSIFETANLKIISQTTRELYQDTEYITDFQYKNLNSENPTLTMPSSTPGTIPFFNPKTLAIIISQNNILCQNQLTSNKCFTYPQVIQVMYEQREIYPNEPQVIPEMTIFYNIKKNAQTKYHVCVTTKNGVMSKVKTEFVKQPFGIKCTFTDNVSLIMDENCDFCTCPQDKPYILDDICVSVCPNIVSPTNKLCVNRVEDCPSKMVSSDGKTCIFKCQGIQYAILDDQGNILSKYCNECPSSNPYKFQKSSTLNVCLETCQDGQIIDQENKNCLNNIDECDKYLVDDLTCQDSCPQNYFLYKNEDTKYKRCTKKCNQFQLQEGESKYCEKSCSNGQIIDNEEKKCFDKKQDCLKIISSNGKECNRKCNTSDFEIIQNQNNYKQCKVCREYIKIEDEQIKCIQRCNQDEMIYIFGKKNELKRCVSKNFCENKKVSIRDSKICSDECIKPFEINYKKQCVLTCPQDTSYSSKQNKCLTECESYLSSDGKNCVQSCAKIFEVIDQSKKDKKQCKKCQENEFFVLQNHQNQQIGVCQVLEINDESRKAIKDNIIAQLTKSSIDSPECLAAAKKVIQSFTNEVENKLKQISNKQKITSYDRVQSKNSFYDVIDITKTLLSNIDMAVQQTPISVGSSELKVTAQVAQQGYKFSTSFYSYQIQTGEIPSLLERNLDDLPNNFDPQILQVSYIKNNHFCRLSDCKDYPPLYVVTYTMQTNQNERILAEKKQFQITYTIPSNQSPKLQLCLAYDKDGTFFTSQGQIKDQYITCSFQYSSALYYDQACDFVNKNNCMQEKQQDNIETAETSKGAIAGIIVGTAGGFLILVGSIIYCIIKKRRQRAENESSFNKSNSLNTTNNNSMVLINMSQIR